MHWFLEVCFCNYFIYLKGTDLNEDVHDEKKFATICSAVANAAELVAFNDDFLQRAKILFPQHVHKLVCIPQSVAVSPCADFSFRTSFGLNNDHIVIALIGGIRPVKDTLFLAQEMDAWHKQDCRIKFVLVGPFRDDAYQSQVQLALTKYQDSLLHVPCLSMEQCHRAMQECNIIVNTSKSECLPNALLEAMSLSVPVFARNIPGNSMVQHMVTGVQFATPSEFVTLAKQVLDNAELRAQLTANAKLYIEKHHSPQYECSQYQALVKRLGNAKTCWDILRKYQSSSWPRFRTSTDKHNGMIFLCLFVFFCFVFVYVFEHI